MSVIAFAGKQTIGTTGTAQPVFGTKTTAATSPTYDQFAGNVTGANPSMTTLTVSSTTGFSKGNVVVVGTATQLANAPFSVGTVFSIASSTSMTVQGLTQSVTSGAYVILNEAAAAVTIIPIVGNTAVLNVGLASTVTATDSSLIYVIPNPTSTTYSYNVFHAETADKSLLYNTSNLWIEGTATDAFVASFVQV